MRTLRIIDSGVRPARWNIAVTAALAGLHRAAAIPDTLRFHRYERSVLLGHHQPAEAGANVGCCRERGVSVARRVTGGGAVYMSPSILAWDLVAGRRQFPGPLERVSADIGAIVVAALNGLGLATRFRPPGDVVIDDGRKVSGSSGGFDGPTLIHQGTIVVDLDRSEAAAVLAPRAGHALPVDGMTSLAECLGETPDVAAVQGALTAAIAHRWRPQITYGDLGGEELRAAGRLLEQELGRDDFVFGPVPAAAASGGGQETRS